MTLACRECDSSEVRRCGTGTSPIAGGPGWRCNTCGARMGQLVEREPKTGGGPRNGLARKLARMGENGAD